MQEKAQDPSGVQDALSIMTRFLDLVFSGRLADACAMVAPDAVFIGASPQPNPVIPFQGRFEGPAAVRAFFEAFGAALEPQVFDVQARLQDRDHVVLYGQLRHRVRATGREFASDWALIGRVQAGRIQAYHFYEDTAALSRAMGLG